MPQADEGIFWKIYESDGPQAATSWLYDQTARLGLLSADGISSGIRWCHESPWGPILITVNEAKPEKDPIDIAAAANSRPLDGACGSDCVFCWDGPCAQKHLRMPIELNGEQWSLHFSPYAYFDEHCIAATKEHRPMRIDRRTFEDLLDLCDMFPHYFFGSNADLPIVGGSILNHHHYQGGRFSFPIDEAPIEREIRIKDAPHVQAGILRWPLAVIRLESTDREEIASAASRILEAWRSFSDLKAGVVSQGEDGTPRNTITPIARKVGDLYRLDLALRNNATSDEHPLGIFHPHSEIHKVKKENIGLIEVMGLAILPPRVANEFEITGPQSPDRQTVGELFVRGMEHCGVPITEGFIEELEHG